ncbi:MAG: hypothetical protein BMS9Abin25_0292 [Gammaproteobacteria bacterium]|nr:MAG: hypothetical protein BMS9Abin25_0292 [Gammaproteobacteria bacterium]
MFRRKDNESSSISMFVEKKTRMLKSKVDFALHGQHRHYFSKKESLDSTANPACKICGMLLSDYKIQKKFEALSKEMKEKNQK